MSALPTNSPVAFHPTNFSLRRQTTTRRAFRGLFPGSPRHVQLKATAANIPTTVSTSPMTSIGTRLLPERGSAAARATAS